MGGISLGRPNFARDPVAKNAAVDEGTRIGPETSFIIHGFNTRYEDADENFDAFESMLADASRATCQPDLVRVSWPGYRGNRLVPQAHFAESEEIATRCADVLARLLLGRLRSGLGPNPHIVLIAHSLGCLIATLVAARLASEGPAALRVTAILMAAAIPVDGDYRALQKRVRTAVLFSAEDKTLRVWFPRGHRSESGTAAEAVGLHGRPDVGRWNERADMETFMHRDYWSKPRAAVAVSRLLGTNAEVARPDRPIASVAAIAERYPPVRDLGG